MSRTVQGDIKQYNNNNNNNVLCAVSAMPVDVAVSVLPFGIPRQDAARLWWVNALGLGH